MDQLIMITISKNRMLTFHVCDLPSTPDEVLI